MEAQQHRPQGHAYEDQDELVLVEKVGLKTALDDDTNAPKEENTASNYQSKVTDPTGANSEEAGTTPLVQSFERMSVKEPKPEKGAESMSKMKEYFAEKFKPREEDKALSEVISGKLSGQKDKTVGSSVETRKAISNVISRKLSEQKDETVRPEETGKAKKPEKVATTQAGPTAATHGEGSGKSMIDRVKGAATSLWVGKRGGKEATQTPSTLEST